LQAAAMSVDQNLALHHGVVSRGHHILTMAHFVFTCPATSMNVQYLLEDDQDAPDNEYEGITCPACAKLHFVNRKTGKLLGQDK
jgi:hypothetical protein